MTDIFKNTTKQKWQDMDTRDENPCVGTKHKSLVDRLCERKATWVGSGDAPDPLCQEAKARLMAAGPDMMDALERALTDEMWDAEMESRKPAKWTHQARAAIAKAKGQAND